MTFPGSDALIHLQDDDDDDLFDDEEDFEREDADDEEDGDDSDDDEDDDDAEDGTWYVLPDGSGRSRTLTSDNELPTLAPS